MAGITIVSLTPQELLRLEEVVWHVLQALLEVLEKSTKDKAECERLEIHFLECSRAGWRTRFEICVFGTGSISKTATNTCLLIERMSIPEFQYLIVRKVGNLFFALTNGRYISKEDTKGYYFALRTPSPEV